MAQSGSDIGGTTQWPRAGQRYQRILGHDPAPTSAMGESSGHGPGPELLVQGNWKSMLTCPSLSCPRPVFVPTLSSLHRSPSQPPSSASSVLPLNEPPQVKPFGPCRSKWGQAHCSGVEVAAYALYLPPPGIQRDIHPHITRPEFRTRSYEVHARPAAGSSRNFASQSAFW